MTWGHGCDRGTARTRLQGSLKVAALQEQAPSLVPSVELPAREKHYLFPTQRGVLQYMASCQSWRFQANDFNSPDQELAQAQGLS